MVLLDEEAIECRRSIADEGRIIRGAAAVVVAPAEAVLLLLFMGDRMAPARIVVAAIRERQFTRRKERAIEESER